MTVYYNAHHAIQDNEGYEEPNIHPQHIPPMPEVEEYEEFHVYTELVGVTKLASATVGEPTGRRCVRSRSCLIKLITAVVITVTVVIIAAVCATLLWPTGRFMIISILLSINKNRECHIFIHKHGLCQVPGKA